MSRTADAIDRLRAADPLAADVAMARDRVAARTAPPAQSKTGRRAPRFLVSAVAVTAAAAIAFVLLPGGAAQPSDARAVDSLLAAGRAAAALVDTPLGPGQLIYNKTVGSYLSFAGGDPAHPAAYMRPTSTEDWIAADGTTTALSVPSGPAWFPSVHDRAVITRLGLLGDGPTLDRIPSSAGSLNGPTYDFARTLPTDPAALEQRIRAATAGSGESADVEVWVSVRDMLASPVCPPSLRAALYQVAAGLPGVEYLGTETDRLGRSGIAVALSHGDDSHARAREVMVFDPRTGLLLQTERRAIDPEQYGLLSSMKDAVVGWQVWEQSAIVDGVGLRPDGSHADLDLPSSASLRS